MATGEQGAAAAMSHTGSLAGSQAAYRAVFRRAGAILVDDYEALWRPRRSSPRRQPPKARGVAVVAASGGAAIMAADRAEQYGVPMPQPSDAVRDVLHRAHPGVRLGAQSVRRDGADPGQSGIAERLRRCAAGRSGVRRAGGAADLRLRAVGEAHPGLRFAGGEARQDRLHRLADASGWKAPA